MKIKKQFYPTGELKSITTYDNEKLHAIDKPAFIVFYKNGDVLREAFYLDGLLHNDQGAADILYDKNGLSIQTLFYDKGKPVDKPNAEIHTNIKITPIQPRIILDDLIRTYEFYEKHLENGRLHRLDGPAFIVFDFDHNIREEHYFKRRLRHRKDGPAIVYRDKSGNVIHSECYIEDSKSVCRENSLFLAEH